MIDRKIDRYLHSEKTLLAKALRKISGSTGPEWDQTGVKRILELSVVLPSVIAAAPLTGALIAANKIIYGGNPLFTQKRLRKEGEEVPVIKIRCMKPGSEKDTNLALAHSAQYKPSEDPRNTGLGKVMRRFDVEELPQLWQVLAGQWRLIAIRTAPQYVFGDLKEKQPGKYHSWKTAYFSQTPGLFSLNSACNPHHKDDSTRIPFDVLHAQKASLGLDLYILYRHLTKGLYSFRRRAQKIQLQRLKAKTVSAELARSAGVEPATVTSEA